MPRVFTFSLDYRVRLCHKNTKQPSPPIHTHTSTSGSTPWSLLPLDPIPSVHFEYTKKPKDQLKGSQSTASTTASEAGSDVSSLAARR